MADDRATPDVTVIVPVYNTMPYLTACLDSLAAQTLGLDRMEVITVDDGSTDDSAKELFRFASDHPDAFHVIQQANSGGPARPCNRGLDAATGRYVYFLGADDYLGEEALQRLVEKADEWGSDVIFGRAEAVGGRFIDQRIYARTRQDIDFHDSRLAFAVSNTKLFRRSLVEQHGLRYPELQVGSDQPFTIAAIVHAARVSVLADYTYYYGVRRDDDTNISYSSAWDARLRDIGAVMHHVADVVPPGPDRDAVVQRHFSWELAKLLRPDFLDLAPDDQRRCAEGIAALMGDYFTDGVSDLLPPNARLRLRLAERGDLDLLGEVIAYRDREPRPPLVIDGQRVFGWFPGFRADRGVPDDWFEITAGNLTGRLSSAVRVDHVELAGDAVRLEGDAALTDDSAPHVRIVLAEGGRTGPLPRARRFPRDRAPADDPGAAVALHQADPGGAAAFRADVSWRPLLHSDQPSGTRFAVRLRIDAGDWTYDLPVHAGACSLTTHGRRGARVFRVVVTVDDDGYLYVRRQQVSPRSVVRSLRRRLGRTGQEGA